MGKLMIERTRDKGYDRSEGAADLFTAFMTDGGNS